MADGYICRRGGTSELNFQVVGGDTQPTGPKANTIWAKTGTAVSAYALSPYTQTSGSEGRLWIKTASTGGVTFNALKKQSWTVNLVGAQQFIGGKYEPVDAYIYTGGEWKQFAAKEQYLFKAGDAMTAVTGGWAVIDGGAALSNALDLEVYYDNKGAQVYTRNRIDLSNYRTLHVKVGATYHDPFMCGVMANAPTTTSGSYSANSAKCAATKTLNAANAEFTLDVSSLSGSYYVWLGEGGTDGATNAGGYVTAIWLT